MKLSIVIPVYNRETIVSRAINSVLSSTRTDIEVLVIDDGSTDQTVKEIKKISDPRLTVIESPENVNANNARNLGAQAAKAPVIAFLDSDDEFLEGRIDRIIKYFEQSDCADVLVDSFLVFKHAEEIEEINFVAGRINNNLFADYLIAHAIPITFSTIVAKKSLLDSLGGIDTSIARHQDRDFLLTASYSDATIALSNGKDVIKHQVDDSFSRSYKGYIAGLDVMVGKHPLFTSAEHSEMLAYFISRVFVKSITTFNPQSFSYNLNALKEASFLNKGLFRQLGLYLKGKKIRKLRIKQFEAGQYD